MLKEGFKSCLRLPRGGLGVWSQTLLCGIQQKDKKQQAQRAAREILIGYGGKIVHTLPHKGSSAIATGPQRGWGISTL